MEIDDPIGVPTSPSPSSWIATNYKLMVAQGEGRSLMTSPDAKTDFKPIIITRALVAASLANFPPAVNSSATCKAWDRLCRPTAGTAKSGGRYCELRYANHRTPLLAAVKLFAATVR